MAATCSVHVRQWDTITTCSEPCATLFQVYAGVEVFDFRVSAPRAEEYWPPRAERKGSGSVLVLRLPDQKPADKLFHPIFVSSTSHHKSDSRSKSLVMLG